MTLKKVFLMGLIAGCISACSQKDEIVDSPSTGLESGIELSAIEIASIAYDNPKEISEDEILNLVQEFSASTLKSTPLGTRSASISMKIADKYYATSGESALTRASNGVASSISLPIYIVNVSGEENEGVAYVAADSRFSSVLAYVPVTDQDNEVPAQNLMLQAAEAAAIDYIENIEEIKSTLRDKTIEKISALLNVHPDEFDFEMVKNEIVTETGEGVVSRAKPVVNPPYPMTVKGPMGQVTWDQHEPYNRKLPAHPNFYDMHYPAGCGITAAATLLSIVEPTMTVSSIPVRWYYLKEGPRIIEPTYGGWGGTPDPQDKRDMVAYLFRDIYYGAKATTTFPDMMGSTTTYDTDLYNYLRNIINIDNWQNMNLDNQLASLNNSRPVLMGGKASANGGSHAWVIDGYMLCRKMTKELVKNYDVYFHANMGWGGSGDGYYMVASNLTLTFETPANHYNTTLRQMCNARKK